MGTSQRELVLKLHDAQSTTAGVLGTAKCASLTPLESFCWVGFFFSSLNCLVGIAHPLCSHPTICQGIMYQKRAAFIIYHSRGQVWLQLLRGRGLGDLEQSLHSHCCWVMSPPPPLQHPRKLWPRCFETLRLHQILVQTICGVKAFGVQQWEPCSSLFVLLLRAKQVKLRTRASKKS